MKEMLGGENQHRATEFPRDKCWEIPEFVNNPLPGLLQQRLKKEGEVPFIPEVTSPFEKQTIQPFPGKDSNNRYIAHLKPFASGGICNVYKVFDRQLEIFLALKVLRPDEYSAENVQILEREAKVMANLQHPNILRVYNFVKLPFPYHPDLENAKEMIPAIFLEFMEPETDLYNIVNKRRLYPKEISQIMTQVAHGIDYMAKRKIFHRDLKPSNLFFEPHTQTAKISDFGFASSVNLKNYLFGTPAFISPEQAINADSVTIESEIFCLGSIVYAFLTQKKRFDFGNDSSPFELALNAIDNDGFTDRNKEYDIRKALDQTGIDPSKVIRVLHRAQRKKRDLRYPSASEFAYELSLALMPR